MEEGFKAIGVILLVSLARAEMDDILDGFIWGAMVGLGFLLVEDVFYFVRAFVQAGGSYDGLFQIFLIRIVGAGPYSHFLYTGLIGMGVAYYVTRPDLPWGRRLAVGIALCAAGVGAHFFWNSPLLAELLGDGGIFNWLLYVTAKGLPMLIGLLVLIRLARRRERGWFERMTVGQVDDGTITAEEMRELGGLRARWRARRASARTRGAAGGKLKGLDPAPADQPGDGREPRGIRRPSGRGEAARPRPRPEGPVRGAPGDRPRGGHACPGTTCPGTTRPRHGRSQPSRRSRSRSRPRHPPPPPPPPAWLPTHLVPIEGMAAWAAPDPTRAPMVSLAGRLELVVVERAGDWARVAAVNGWNGWVDGRRLVPGP